MVELFSALNRLSLRFATHGDSLVNNGLPYTNGIHQDISQNGWFGWADAMSGGRLNLVYNGGVGGETAAQIAARVATTLLATPDIVLEDGGTNDLGTATTADAIVASRLSVWDALLRAGCIVLAMTLPARGGLSAAQMIKLFNVNAQLKYYAQRYQTRGYPVIIVDAAAVTTNPDTGVPLVSAAFGAIDDMIDTGDNTHFTASGGASFGALVADAINAFLPAPAWGLPQGGTTNLDLAYDATNGYNVAGNLIANGKMSGTSGTVGAPATGSLANNWATNGPAVAAGGGSIALSKVAMTGGKKFGTWQQIAAGAGSSGNNNTLYLFNEAVASGYAVGDVLKARCLFETDAANWCAADGLSRNNISLEISCANSGFTTLATARVFPMLATNGRFRMASGVLTTPEVTIPANTAHVYLWLRFSGVGTVRAGDFQLRRSAYL